MSQPPVCPYCEATAELVGGELIYPHRPDLAPKQFWRCPGACGAFVGCHPGTTKPLGSLANALLRRWRSEAHRAFDPLWKNGPMKRTEAYAWLARKLGIEPHRCHIGEMDEATCRKLIGLVAVHFP